jgi:hypothetical protein
VDGNREGIRLIDGTCEGGTDGTVVGLSVGEQEGKIEGVLEGEKVSTAGDNYHRLEK